jgi:hypothetical protein
MIRKLNFLLVNLFLFGILVSQEEVYQYPGGEFRQKNGIWEQNKASIKFQWIESSRDKDWITLYNPKTQETYIFPISGGQAFEAVTSKKNKWKPLFIVKNLTKENSRQTQEVFSMKNLNELKPMQVEAVEKDMTGCLSEEEAWISRKILEYRAKKNLSPIPISSSLSHVAKLHAKDLNENPREANCALQSWSNSAKWKGCCYTLDHSNIQCMLDKPRELTEYTGDGYEIVFESNQELTKEKVLEMWKGSENYARVIGNGKNWEKEKWKAMGLAILGRYAVLWLGLEVDPKPIAGICKK